jgi:hypothetical protein
VSAEHRSQLRVGRLTKAHGLKGALKIELYTDEPEKRFVPGATFSLQVPEESPWHGKPLTLTELRWYNGTAVGFFVDVDDRTQAETLARAILWIDVDTELSPEELELFEIAFKNSIAPKRRSWRVILDEERHQSGIGNERFAALARSERISAEFELVEILGNGLDITKDLLGRTNRLHSKIILQKIKGDLDRYLAEIYMARGSEAREQVIEIAQQAKSAFDLATELARELDATDPLRLSISLHFSLFTHEILGRPKQACIIARDAFEAGSAQLGSITNESSRKKTADLLQSLRDNLCLWTSSRVP